MVCGLRLLISRLSCLSENRVTALLNIQVVGLSHSHDFDMAGATSIHADADLCELQGTRRDIIYLATFPGHGFLF